MPKILPKWSLWLLGIVLLLSVSLPYVLSKSLKWALADWLSEQGATEVELQHLWLNPYNGHGQVLGLQFKRDGQAYHLKKLSFTIQWWRLRNHQLHISELNLSDVTLDLQQTQDSFIVNGLSFSTADNSDEPESTQAESTPPWDFQVDALSFDDVSVSYSDGDLKLQSQVDDLLIQSFNSNSQQQATIKLDGQLITFKWASQKLDFKGSIESNAKLSITQSETGWQITLDDTVELNDWVSTTQAGNAKIADAELELSGQVQMDNGLVGVNLTSDLNLKKAHWKTVLNDKEPMPVELIGDLSSKGKVQVSQSKVGWKIQLTNDLDVDELQAITQGVQTTLDSATARIDGTLNVDKSIAYEFNWQLKADELISQEQQKTELVWLRWIAFSAEGELLTHQVNVHQSQLEKLNVMQSEKHTLLEDLDVSLKKLQLDLVSEKNTTPNLTVSEVNIPKATINAYFKQSDSGRLQQVQPFMAALERFQKNREKDIAKKNVSASSTKTTEGKKQNSDSAGEVANELSGAANNPTMPITLNSVQLGPDVVFHLQDDSFSPRVDQNITVAHGKVKDLSIFDKKTRSPFELKLTLEDGSQADFKGEMNIQQPYVQMEANISQFQVFTLSGLMEQYTGYALESGTLGFQSQFTLEGQKLNSQNRISLKAVKIRSEKSAIAQRFAQQISMPLDQALDLLRDSKNHINLNVPVSGDLSKPDVNLQQVINKALSGAIKKTSVLVLKALLQPYSTIFAVASYVGEQATKVSLQPVLFAAGSHELDSTAEDYTKKLAQILSKRDAVTVNVCGMTSRADRELLVKQLDQPAAAVATATGDKLATAGASSAANSSNTAQISASQNNTSQTNSTQNTALQDAALKQSLYDLGKARAIAVHKRLLSLGVDAKQLQPCLPEYSASSAAQPSVQLSL